MSGAAMATRQSSPVNGPTASMMLASSCAMPTWSRRPSESTAATPVCFLSPHARSSPTKYIGLACLTRAVSCVSVTIPNVLASRYASDEMVVIWSPEAKVVAERRLWLAVLRAQASLGTEGVAVPSSVLSDYERVLDDVDLSSIAERERVLRHDVKARIEEFNALAGHEHVHKGMTSRDLTENVEQLQIRRSLELVFAHGVAVVARLAERAISYRDLVMAGRSHNVAA